MRFPAVKHLPATACPLFKQPIFTSHPLGFTVGRKPGTSTMSVAAVVLARRPKADWGTARLRPTVEPERGRTQRGRRACHPIRNNAAPFLRSHGTAVGRCGVSCSTNAQNKGPWFMWRRCATSCAAT